MRWTRALGSGACAAVLLSAAALLAGVLRSPVLAPLSLAGPLRAAQSSRSSGDDRSSLDADSGADLSAEELAPAEDTVPIPPEPSDYGLRIDQRAALDRYRAAASSEEREQPLLELALSDDPAVLDFLLDEYGRAPADRGRLLDAVIQFASRDAIPRLRELAAGAQDSKERQDLLEAAEYLALPSLTEYRARTARGESAPAPR